MTCVDHAHAFKARLSGKEQTASCRLEPNSLSPCLSSSCFAAVLWSAPMVLFRCQTRAQKPLPAIDNADSWSVRAKREIPPERCRCSQQRKQ